MRFPRIFGSLADRPGEMGGDPHYVSALVPRFKLAFGTFGGAFSALPGPIFCPSEHINTRLSCV